MDWSDVKRTVSTFPLVLYVFLLKEASLPAAFTSSLLPSITYTKSYFATVSSAVKVAAMTLPAGAVMTYVQ